MEFKSLKNIETSFRQIRLFTLVFACLCAVVTGFALWKSYSFAEAQRQKIYVLDNGKSVRCCWRTRAPSTTTRTSRKRGITTG